MISIFLVNFFFGPNFFKGISYIKLKAISQISIFFVPIHFSRDFLYKMVDLFPRCPLPDSLSLGSSANLTARLTGRVYGTDVTDGTGRTVIKSVLQFCYFKIY